MYPTTLAVVTLKLLINNQAAKGSPFCGLSRDSETHGLAIRKKYEVDVRFPSKSRALVNSTVPWPIDLARGVAFCLMEWTALRDEAVSCAFAVGCPRKSPAQITLGQAICFSPTRNVAWDCPDKVPSCQSSPCQQRGRLVSCPVVCSSFMHMANPYLRRHLRKWETLGYQSSGLSLVSVLAVRAILCYHVAF